jgi:hypothetical protein
LYSGAATNSLLLSPEDRIQGKAVVQQLASLEPIRVLTLWNTADEYGPLHRRPASEIEVILENPETAEIVAFAYGHPLTKSSVWWDATSKCDDERFRLARAKDGFALLDFVVHDTVEPSEVARLKGFLSAQMQRPVVLLKARSTASIRASCLREGWQEIGQASSVLDLPNSYIMYSKSAANW